MRLFIVFILISSFAFAQQDNQKLAYQYYINGEYSKAISIYKELDKKQSSVAYYSPYFYSLFKSEQFREAEQLAKKLAKKYPNSLNYQFEVGLAQERSGNVRKSEETYKKLLQNLSGNRSQTINLANAYSRYNMYEDALNVYLLSEKINSEANFGTQKAQLYAHLGKSDKMIEQYLEVLLRDPNQKSIIMSKVQRFLDNDGIKSDKNYKLVKNALLLYVRNEDNRTDFSEMLIWLFMQNGQYRMALIQAKALDRRTNSEGESVFDLGESFLDKKHYNLAVEAYDYVLKKGKNNFLFVSASINKLYALTKELNEQKKDLNQIDIKYKEVIEELGKSRSTVLLLSNYAHFKAFYLHDLFAAEQILNEAMDLRDISNTDLAECKLEYADVMLLKGNIWESLLYYSQVEKDFKENPIGHEAKLRRAKIAYYQGDFKWAQAQLSVLKSSTSKLIANDAMDLSLLITDNYNLDTTEIAMKTFANADLLTYQKKYIEAIAKYDSVLMFFSGHSLSDEIYMRKAEIYSLIDKDDIALEMYQKIINDWNYDILADDALYRQAKIYDNILDDSVKAMSLYEKILLEHSGSIFTVESRKRYRVLRGDNINIE